MRITTLLLLVCLFQLHANDSYAQKTKITLDYKNVSLETVFSKIESVTNFKFIYKDKEIDYNQKVSIKVKKEKLSKLLKNLLTKTKISYSIFGKQIILKPQKTNLNKENFKQQQQKITGTIVDKEGIPILGASVFLKGTKKGTTTNFDGKFSLDLTETSTVIVVSFLGYKTQEINVKNKSSISIVLLEDSTQLNEIVIVGFRKSLEKSLEIKKNKSNSVDAIVAEDIAKFPQSNMAESLQRVSGVQIRRDDAGGVGNSVSIRGLSSEYTQVTINGDAVPNSTDSRSYDFNTLPAEIFQQVEVLKTPTAKTTEGGIGGSVNMVTKKPFQLKKRVMIASAEGLFNTQQQQGNSITPKMSFTYGNNWNKKFGLITGLFYNKFFNTSEGYDVTRYYDESYDIDGDGVNEFQEIQVPRPRYISQGQEVERLTFNLSMQYQVNKDFDVVFEGMFVNNDQTQTRYTPIWFFPGKNPSNIIADGPFVKSITFDEVTSKLENQQQKNITRNYSWSLKGKYKLPNNWKIGIKFVHAFNKRDSERYRYYADNVNTATYNIQNDIQFFDLQTPTNFSNTDEFVMSQARRYLWDYSDEILTSKLDISKKFNSKFNIEFGTSYRDRTKTLQYFFRREDIANEDFSSVAALLTGFLDNVDRAKGFNEFLVHDFNKSYNLYGSKLNLDDYEVIDAAYDINEEITAGYLQGNYSTKKLNVNAGLRVIHTAIKSRGYQLDDATQIYQVREIPSNYLDLLPSVNIKWEFSRGLIARAGFARVITRPRLQDLSAFRVIDEVNERISANNPELNPFRANQYDISLEWYPIPETLISGGFFLKDIESFISRQTTLIPFNGSQYELRQPVNGNNATIKGFEFNFQQPFSFLPGFLNGLGIVSNYTFSESDFQETLADGSLTTYSLPNNSKHTFNITPYYEKYGFSLRVATNFRSSFLREIPNPEDGLKFRDDVTITDVSSSYDFNDNFGITLNILNAFNAKRFEYIMEERFMDNVSFFGTTFQLGARFKF